MLEHPSHAGRVPFRIPGSPDGVESEANAENSSDRPVGDTVAEEVEEGPSCDHGYDGGGFRGGGSCQSESGTGGYKPDGLNYIAANDRQAAEDFSSDAEHIASAEHFLQLLFQFD